MSLTFHNDKTTGLKGKTLILYDGVCGLCNGFVKFLLPRDPEGKLFYASLQSEFALSIMQSKNLGQLELQTVLVITNYSLPGEKILTRSDAAIEAIATLGGTYRILKWSKIIPKALRDALYNLIARNRYKIFGKSETCMLPDVSKAARFIDI